MCALTFNVRGDATTVSRFFDHSPVRLVERFQTSTAQETDVLIEVEDADVDYVTDWCEAHGLTITMV